MGDAGERGRVAAVIAAAGGSGSGSAEASPMPTVPRSAEINVRAGVPMAVIKTARAAFWESERVRAILHKFWLMDQRAIDHACDRRQYVQLNMRLYKALVQPFDFDASLHAVLADWQREARSCQAISWPRFAASLLAVADRWVADVDEWQCIRFLEALFRTTTYRVRLVGVVCWRPLAGVHPISEASVAACHVTSDDFDPSLLFGAPIATSMPAPAAAAATTLASSASGSARPGARAPPSAGRRRPLSAAGASLSPGSPTVGETVPDVDLDSDDVLVASLQQQQSAAGMDELASAAPERMLANALRTEILRFHYGVREVFDLVDSDKDGHITVANLTALLQGFGLLDDLQLYSSAVTEQPGASARRGRGAAPSAASQPLVALPLDEQVERLYRYLDAGHTYCLSYADFALALEGVTGGAHRTRLIPTRVIEDVLLALASLGPLQATFHALSDRSRALLSRVDFARGLKRLRMGWPFGVPFDVANAAFVLIDDDGDGKISAADLERALRLLIAAHRARASARAPQVRLGGDGALRASASAASSSAASPFRPAHVR